MKLSSISLNTLSPETDLTDLYKGINNTKIDYPKDKSIVDIFRDVVVQYPLKTAVKLNDDTLSYEELDQRSNQVAHWLLSRGVESESVVAIYFDRSIEMIIGILGILKAGAAYLPLNIEYPIERNRYMLNEANAVVLISTSGFMREINQLQWFCTGLHSVLCIDSENFYQETESANPLMKKELWEYVGETAEDDIEGGGWKNSYTAEKFSRVIMDEYAENAYLKLKPYLDKTKKVLEIGCASGITMYKVAPDVKLYYGTDLSSSIIEYNQQKCNENGIGNIKLKCLGAGDIDTLNEGKFDVIVINSVIQAFNGLNYLRQIINKACNLLNENGILFIGDVMDLDLRHELIKSVQDFKKQNPAANTKLDFSNELFVSRRFFEDCRVEMPFIQNVIATSKIYTVKNELTTFRYDVILKVNRKKDRQVTEKFKFQFDASHLENFPVKPVDLKISPDQLSNVMFTSGSTGTPKGVMIEHHCITRLVMNSNFLDVNANDNWLQTAEVSFDPSCMEIFATLLNGGTLCLVAKDVVLDSDALREYMLSCNITILQLVSALFHRLAEQNTGLFSNVRKLVIGGEVLSPKLVKNVKHTCPGLTIINAYGPTENCVVSTAFVIDDDYETIPIGKPISNSGIYILNSQLQLQPVGIVGELYLSGDGLARGYIGNEALNADKFITSPFNPSEKIYRTGDLARLKPDLNLEFIGRKDSQVKINGHRVELAEIENTLKSIIDVHQAVVTTKGKNKELCAYIIMPGEVSSDNIKQLLSAILPEHMVPQYIVKLEEFPMTPNGKIDVNSLPEPDISLTYADTIIEAVNETQQKVLDIFKEVLGREKIGTDQNFFQIGGHSLLATQVLSRINKELNVGIKLKSIFNYPTAAGLADEITKSEAVNYQEIVPVKAQDHYAPSHAQERLWVLNHMPEFKTAYNMIDVYRFKGMLDKRALENALKTLVSRHEILRTVFDVVDGNPQQKIIELSDLNFAIDYQDLKEFKNNDALARQIVNDEASYVFDLENGPLFRAKLLELAADNYVLVLSMHHIVSDGWSLWIIINELLALYSAYSQKQPHKLSPLKIQYKDYAAWQNNLLQGASYQKLKNYWLNQFKNSVPELNLPFDFPREEVKNTRAEKIFFSLPANISKGLNDLSENDNSTIFMCLAAMVKVLLYKYTGETDITIGTPIAGRDHKDLESQVGIYLNTLALRSKIEVNKNFSNYLNEVKEVTMDAYEHQAYPFNALIEDLNIERHTNRSPLFDIGFTWQNIDGPEGDKNVNQLNNIEVEPFEYDFQNVKTDIWFHGWENDGLINMSLSYNLSLFRRETIDNMIAGFKQLAKILINDTSKSIKAIADVLISSDRQRKVEDFNKIKENKFERFFNIKKKTLGVDKPAVSESFFTSRYTYPLVIKPQMEGLILKKWIENNTTHIQNLLLKHGGILFRDFNISTMAGFQEIASSLSDHQMAYMDQSSPRTLLSEKTYTSTDHPEDQVINMHNELSYSHDWPMQILFYCLKPAETDGETPIADSRKVLQFLSESTREKFASKGIKYVRNLVKGFGLSWQDVYQTNDRLIVEEYCTERGIEFEWIGETNLRISWNRPAIRIHPVTNEETWFNHGFFFNAFNLDESVHEAVADKNMLPFNTFYGDGSEIEPNVLVEIRDAYERAKVIFKWKQGDIILLDNMLMAHGRNSYSGERKVLVAMNNPFSMTNVELTAIN
jgi:amino acid adenylation domain-containing protein